MFTVYNDKKVSFVSFFSFVSVKICYNGGKESEKYEYDS